ncbi:hypothetical protein YC2023_020246 [Brassica napus]
MISGGGAEEERHGLLTRVNLSTFAVFERRWVVVGFESLSRFCCPYQREREDTDKREMNVVWGVESKTGFVEDNTNRS